MTVAHEEDIAGGALNLPGEQKRMAVPHVLKDGADSVGLVGALSRVYVSIGEYSQEWLRDHNVMVGGRPQRPFEVAKAQKNSVYWQSTAERVPDLARFLMRMQGPKLADAPGGKSYLTHGRGHPTAREDRVRGELRPVPLQQATATGLVHHPTAIPRLDASRGPEARLPR